MYKEVNKMNYSQDIIDRFWSKVNYPGNDQDCWLWTGGPYDTQQKKYYGRFRIDVKNQIRAHVFAFQFFNGSFKSGLYVCHKCDTPKCVNPNHLFLGTAKDNKKDAMSKNRHVYGETHGCSILCEQDIYEIFNHIKLGNFTNLDQISEEYGISIIGLRKIFNRTTWKHITNLLTDDELNHIKFKVENKPHINSSKLSEDEVQEIRERLNNGECGRGLANEYLMSEAAISNIKNNKQWK